MTVVEKIAYTKGFFSGLNIDDTSAEGKAFNALLELLEEMVVSNSDLEKQCEKLKEQVSQIDEHVSEIFNDVFDNASYVNGYQGHREDAVLYEVICPECGVRTTFGAQTVDIGYMDCPSCGIHLEFDFEDVPSKTFEMPPPEMGSAVPHSLEKTLPEPFAEQSDASFPDAVSSPVISSTKEGEEVAALPFLPPSPVQVPEEGEDHIPQTEEFVYTESTDDDDVINDNSSVSDAVEKMLTPEGEVAETTENEKEESHTSSVKVEFVADPAAFEAGRKAAAEYAFSTDNVTTDFGLLIPGGVKAEE